MEHPDYNSPVALKEFLDAHGMAMQKKFGQNFLVNGAARDKIIAALDVADGMDVWEVGPGLGAMTAGILARGARVTAFEIDHGFARLLHDIFASEEGAGRFVLVEGDVLKTWKPHLGAHGAPARFFGNLPYNVAASVIADTISAGVRFEKMVVTLQKEVALRMAAQAGTAQYSSFSALCQWAYRVRTVSDLAGGSFWPVPNVASRAVLLERRDDFPRCADPALFVRLVRALFSSRRKTVRNNLLALAPAAVCDAALGDAGIAPSARAEDIGIDALLALSDALGARR